MATHLESVQSGEGFDPSTGINPQLTLLTPESWPFEKERSVCRSPVDGAQPSATDTTAMPTGCWEFDFMQYYCENCPVFQNTESKNQLLIASDPEQADQDSSLVLRIEPVQSINDPKTKEWILAESKWKSSIEECEGFLNSLMVPDRRLNADATQAAAETRDHRRTRLPDAPWKSGARVSRNANRFDIVKRETIDQETGLEDPKSLIREGDAYYAIRESRKADKKKTARATKTRRVTKPGKATNMRKATKV